MKNPFSSLSHVLGHLEVSRQTKECSLTMKHHWSLILHSLPKKKCLHTRLNIVNIVLGTISSRVSLILSEIYVFFCITTKTGDLQAKWLQIELKILHKLSRERNIFCLFVFKHGIFYNLLCHSGYTFLSHNYCSESQPALGKPNTEAPLGGVGPETSYCYN